MGGEKGVLRFLSQTPRIRAQPQKSLARPLTSQSS